MIIGIDGNEANVSKRVGISEYAYQLLKHFSLIRKEGQFFWIYLKSVPREDLPVPTDWWRYKIIGPGRFWTQFALPIHLYFDRPRPDVFFSPTHYAPRFSPTPTAISVMDLSYIYFPEMFDTHDLYQLRAWTKYSVKHAKKVFTISKSSRNDIIKTYNVPDEAVVVTYPGMKDFSPSKSLPFAPIAKKYGVTGNFILFVGTLQPRKNIVRLIEAYSLLRKKMDDKKTISLVLIGKQGWMYDDIFQAPKKFNVENSVHFLHFVPDDDLRAFYENARCFILPSLYEGFGLPVLEAMGYGCPVIISNVSSLPEIGGDAALYVDPMNVSDIAEKMTKVVTSEQLQKTMREKGLQQIKKFSWEKTAKETLTVLENLVSK